MQKSITSKKKLSPNAPVALGNNKITKNLTVKRTKVKAAEKPKTLLDKIDILLETNYDIETISLLNYAKQTQIGVTFNKFQTVADAIRFEDQTDSYIVLFDAIDEHKQVIVFYTTEGLEANDLPITDLDKAAVKKDTLARDAFYKATGMRGYPKQ